MSQTPWLGLHSVDDGKNTSAGQSLLVPSQYSAISQTPAAALHSAVDLVSDGQLGPVPVHDSATSQAPWLGLHSVDDGKNTSAGQSLLNPSQYSALSQTPAGDLHSPVDFVSSGQIGPVPVQYSALSHIPATGLHTVVDGSKSTWHV
jgi:hypothetical protein